MATAPELEELELALNEVTPDGAKELAAALVNKTKLQKLNLRENELEDRGVILLSGPVQSLPALRIVDLAQNQVCSLGFLQAAVHTCQVQVSAQVLCLEEAWHPITHGILLLVACLPNGSKPIRNNFCMCQPFVQQPLLLHQSHSLTSIQFLNLSKQAHIAVLLQVPAFCATTHQCVSQDVASH